MVLNKFGFSGLASQIGGKLRHWSDATLGLTPGSATSSVTLGRSVSLFKPRFLLLYIGKGDNIYPLEQLWELNKMS